MISQMPLLAKLESMMVPTVRSLGYEIVDLETAQGETGPLLRVYIDSSLGKPISFDDCVAVDHGLEPVIASEEFESLMASQFTLEVSSPGVDRALRTEADFQKAIGRCLQIKTNRTLTQEEMDNNHYFAHHETQKNFKGRLVDLTGTSLTLETDGQKFSIPALVITKANLDTWAEEKLGKKLIKKKEKVK